MIKRPANERGETTTDWLRSRHSFSFGEYYDRQHMSFRSLRVINDDIVAASAGFGMHGHRDMEIITIVVAGALTHRDSLGHEETLHPGEVQVMTAGRGIRHSEFNPSSSEAAHFIQIWIEPHSVGLAPSYAQREFPGEQRVNTLVRVAGQLREGDPALPINQDAHVYLSSVTAGHSVTHMQRQGRGVWVQIVKGECLVNEIELTTGDGLACEQGSTLTIRGVALTTEIILFDLA